MLDGEGVIYVPLRPNTLLLTRFCVPALSLSAQWIWKKAHQRTQEEQSMWSDALV